ncbi:hypothetical protein FQR65_LT13336 [Abscondita terminalis]|nr:hypothetical protein FQR65_LT13336 [Abscondita terminalis]
MLKEKCTSVVITTPKCCAATPKSIKQLCQIDIVKEMQSLRTKRKNNWMTRNDSTSVAQVLHPHYIENGSCRRHSSPRINRKDNKTCYCQRPPVRSKFNFNKDSSRINTNVEECSKRTRLPISSYRIEEPKNLPAKLVYKEEEVIKKNPNGEEVNYYETPFQSKEIEKNLKDLNTFRKENYFDCHSTQNLNDKLDDHVCLHKFVLNERLMPQPLNPDPFGTSRCTYCNRPMDFIESSKPPKEKSKGVTEIQIPTNLHKFAKLLDSSGKLKVVHPYNSIALRHQKGVHLE